MIFSEQLTVVTVSYQSRLQIELNYELFRLKNPHAHCHWIVVENSPPNSDKAFTLSSPHIETLPGPDPVDPGINGSASYHHGMGLNLGIRQVKTRYALVLDPDFYITCNNWTEVVLAYMRDNKLALLGSPWHPAKPTKIRYFPAVHCTFIDLEKIDQNILDFTPDFVNEPGYLRMKSLRKSKLGKKISKIIHPKRLRVGSCRDTGWKLFNDYQHLLENSAECFQAVWHNHRPQSRLDKFLPDAYSLSPRRPDYYTQQGYETIGYPEIGQYGWEEFLWQNKPLGFHLRSTPIRSTKGNNEQQHLSQLKDLLSRGFSEN